MEKVGGRRGRIWQGEERDNLVGWRMGETSSPLIFNFSQLIHKSRADNEVLTK